MTGQYTHFRRPHHQKIAIILESLDSDLLQSCECYFGGGTAIALVKGEYRESVDVDFIVSSSDGYKRLRELVKSEGGFANLCIKKFDRLEFTEVRADQYGLRARVILDNDTTIKFEIVREGRILLSQPSPREQVCGIATLAREDMATTKLLANSDRWADRGVHSRDLIDLVMLELSEKELLSAINKAEKAYGKSVQRDLNKAIDYLLNTQGRLEECMAAMKMEIPKALIWQLILKLRKRTSAIKE